jgi:hypothetical protein
MKHLLLLTMSETRCFIDWDYEEDQVLHLLRPRVTPGALLIEIMSKSGASFIENTSETRCFIDWDYESEQVLPTSTHNLNQ